MTLSSLRDLDSSPLHETRSWQTPLKESRQLQTLSLPLDHILAVWIKQWWGTPLSFIERSNPPQTRSYRLQPPLYNTPHPLGQQGSLHLSLVHRQQHASSNLTLFLVLSLFEDIFSLYQLIIHFVFASLGQASHVGMGNDTLGNNLIC